MRKSLLHKLREMSHLPCENSVGHHCSQPALACTAGPMQVSGITYLTDVPARIEIGLDYLIVGALNIKLAI